MQIVLLETYTFLPSNVAEIPQLPKSKKLRLTRCTPYSRTAVRLYLPMYNKKPAPRRYRLFVWGRGVLLVVGLGFALLLFLARQLRLL
jgi:hypothetical protein